MQSAIATLRLETAMGMGLLGNNFVWTFAVWAFESIDEMVLAATDTLEGRTSPIWISLSTLMGLAFKSMDLRNFPFLFEVMLSTTHDY